MKANKLFSIIALLAIITIGFIACNNDNDTSSHTHEWGDWVVTTPATCTTEGVETKTCALDATHTETRSIPALGHDWGDWVVTKKPTVTEEGEETKTCKRDSSHTETRVIEKLDNITPRDQIAIITVNFKKIGATDNDPFLTVTVQGTMTDAQWDGVADKIAKLIDDDYNVMNASGKNEYKTLMARGVIYIVEPSPKGYTNVKVNGDGKTIYIALSNVGIAKWVIDTLNDIYAYRTGVANAIDNDSNAIRMAAIQQKHDRVHAG
jgi:hypothetical protein